MLMSIVSAKTGGTTIRSATRNAINVITVFRPRPIDDCLKFWMWIIGTNRLMFLHLMVIKKLGDVPDDLSGL